MVRWLDTLVAGSGFAEKFLRVGIFVGLLWLFRQAKAVFNSVACVRLVVRNMGYQTNIVGWQEVALDGRMAEPKVVV